MSSQVDAPATDASVPPLERFGRTYVNSKGERYLQVDGVGVQVGLCRPFHTTVASSVDNPGSGWHQVTLNGIDGTFDLHVNWTSEFGDLQAGEEVEGVIHVGENKFWVLTRVPKPTDVAH